MGIAAVTILPRQVFGAMGGNKQYVAPSDQLTRGIIGVVGPTRMDYSTVAAKLSILAAGLSRRLGGGEAPPEGMHTKLIIKGDTGNE